VRRVDVAPCDQSAPELRLPAQVGVEPAVVTGEPALLELRPLPRIRREQSRKTARDGVPAALAELLLLAPLEVAEVGRDGPAPGLVEAGVDDVEQRPRHGVRRPWVVLDGPGELGDQRRGRAEGDARAHTIGAVAATKHVRESLGQPPLHAARRDKHEFLGERVG